MKYCIDLLCGHGLQIRAIVYEIAKEGGFHSGFYKNALSQTEKQLEKGIKKIQRQIEEHMELIKNPKEMMEKLGKGDWEALDPRQQKALLEKKMA